MRIPKAVADTLYAVLDLASSNAEPENDLPTLEAPEREIQQAREWLNKATQPRAYTLRLRAVADSFARLYRERTLAVMESRACVEWVPEDARVLFCELQAEHAWLTIHDRAELQPLIDAARRRINRELRKAARS